MVTVVLNESADTTIQTCCYFFNFKTACCDPPYKDMVASWNIHIPRISHFETQMQIDSLPINPKVKCLLCQVMDQNIPAWIYVVSPYQSSTNQKRLAWHCQDSCSTITAYIDLKSMLSCFIATSLYGNTEWRINCMQGVIFDMRV